MFTQLIGVAATWVFAVIMTFVLIKLISVFMQVRVNETDEEIGLDITEHGERGYSYQDVSAGSSISFATALQSSEKSTVPSWKTAQPRV